MTHEPVRRWDAPWVTPVGAEPRRGEGEPSFAVLAALHLGLLLGLGALLSLLAVPSDDDLALAGALYGVLAAALVGGGAACVPQGRRSGNRLWDWSADLLLASGAVVAGVAASCLAVGGGSGSGDAGAVASVGAAVTAVAAGAAYVLVRRTWLLLTTVGALATLVTALTQRGDGDAAVESGAVLVVLAALVLAGAIARALRPVGTAYVAAALVAVAGAQVLLAGDDGPSAGFGLGYAVSVVVLVAVAYGILRTRSASILPVALLGGFVLLPQVLSPALGGGYAFGLSVLGVGAGVAWLCVDVVRRSVQPVHTGGVFLTCSVFVLIAGPSLIAAGNDLAGLVAVLLVAGFFGAAASARRRPATVLAGLVLVLGGPGAVVAPFDGGDVAGSVIGLLLVPVVVLAAVQLDRRAPRPAASAHGQEQALAGAGEGFTVVAAYPVVFDTTVSLLGSAGLALQLVDRAGGRIVAGDAAAPVFVVAVWAADQVRTHLRVVGAPHDVSRLRADLEARLTAPTTTPYGSP